MTEHEKSQGMTLISSGTQVVTLIDILAKDGQVLHPVRSVATIVKAPSDLEHAYWVRFPDGSEASLKSNQLVMLSKFKVSESDDVSAVGFDELYARVIFRCVIGSRAYGLDDDQSDVDYRGVYLPTADQQWSLHSVPEQLEREDTQEVYWELRKFIILALKANPNVMECLYSPLIQSITPLGEELLSIRSIFLSKLVYQTFNGYVMSQFKKMQADIRNQGQVKWKHVMHLIRLLISGVHVLREGSFQVRVAEHRNVLQAIKHGKLPWSETERLRLSLHEEFDRAFRTTHLPERPNYEQANAFLIKARRLAILENLP